MKILYRLLLVMILSSCSMFEEDEITSKIPIETISLNNKSNLTVEFTASNSCGSKCWKKTYCEKKTNGNDVFIMALSVSDGSTVCPAVCVSVDIPVSVSLPTRGSYTFHFWRSDTSSIDTTLILGM